MLLLATIIAFLPLQSSVVATRYFRRQEITSPLVDQTYDYVVVGGGTGGSAIATRLAQNDFKVALIEAGGHYELESHAEIPVMDTSPVGSDPNTQSPIDWGFVTRGQPGANYRPIHYARGKCLGGSSALNFMVYQRPTRESMDEWVNAVNDSTYAFDKVLPFYKHSINFTPPNDDDRAANATADYNPDAYDKDGGPLSVSYANFAMPFSSWMDLGMQAIGIKKTDDFNFGSLMGAQYCASTINPSNSLRSSSDTFLKDAPVGLTIYTETLAKRILFDRRKRATGVEVKGSLGDHVTISAVKEVIISAGTFQSPQLLMVSGIGPSDELQEHGIEIIADRPGVGQNMWDHPFVGPSYRVKVITLTRFVNDVRYAADQVAAGILTNNSVLVNPIADFLAWEKIPQFLRSFFSLQTREKLSKFSNDWPEAEYLSSAAYVGNLSNPSVNGPKDGYQYASILGILITPLSRGNITLNSADTEDLPIINPNWLDDRADQEVAVAVFKRIRQAFQSKAMAPVVIGEEYDPGPQVQSDDQILEWIKNNVMTLWHAACTCKMGVSDDPMAVVDSRARVYGVQGLRVVDASAFPFLPPGHPQSTIYMLAEKIAEDIIRDS